MDIQAKTVSDDKKLISQAMATREEVMDKLFTDAKVVDISDEDKDDLEDSGKLNG